jgi:hypothetical protein
VTRKFLNSDDLPTKTEGYFGCATMEEPAATSMGIQLTLGEAAMLNIALQAALLELNRYNENAPGVGTLRIELSVKKDQKPVAVIVRRARSR